MSYILAVKVAQAETLSLSDGSDIVTAIRKKAVNNVRVHRLGAQGNDVADKKHHGGTDKALFFMAQKSLEKLTALLRLNYDYLQDSRFGENFVVSELDENSVCIGDRYRIGSALVEVCQPRKPCNTLSKNTEMPETRKTVVETGLVGWYVRVLQSGVISPGDKLELIKRPYPEMTVAVVHGLLSQPAKDLDKTVLDKAIDCPPLAEGYKKTLYKQADKLAQKSSESAFFNTPEF
ncbi:MOSC domain-containing protein [Actinobacillus succinogenes]|uniref:MOSC domain containing protein n=1 Tax=Actinobacillus succinogenes (strain ATCC 55618 / DSM 22257 / CCUG 43843 / 130Z) TaxID=339671 RepID=A6VQ72_ACTSZ|nr:MOSC domain-containing protein [Actinobacillus succinogenes]ABR75119.1 MOSC domain containing protein [Actinobacillus succinogenes 130Z]PHI40483.1 MOSC domain-containing protein [Actinobacillus succinogenes]